MNETEKTLTEKQKQVMPVATVPEKQQFENEFDVSSMLTTAGTVKITGQQKEILYAPITAGDIEIRGDGVVYLPWMEYATRLTKAFDIEWALIPQGMPRQKTKIHRDDREEIRVIWGFWLIIKGALYGFAIGEQRYFSESRGGKDFMGYSDACEGAKSNALMRLCKGIGIGLELWKPAFIRDWKEKNAIIEIDKRGKETWKRAENKPAPELVEPDIPWPKPPAKESPTLKENNQAPIIEEFRAIMADGVFTDAERDAVILQMKNKTDEQLTNLKNFWKAQRDLKKEPEDPVGSGH